MSYNGMSPTATADVSRRSRQRRARSCGVRALSCLTALVSVLSAGPAAASQLIDRNATDVQLFVDAKGEAMLTYTAGGKTKHVLAWGAVNAIPPNRSRPQTA